CQVAMDDAEGAGSWGSVVQMAGRGRAPEGSMVCLPEPGDYAAWAGWRSDDGLQSSRWGGVQAYPRVQSDGNGLRDGVADTITAAGHADGGGGAADRRSGKCAAVRQVMGYVTSGHPPGAWGAGTHAAPVVAVCTAAAVMRLRGAQYISGSWGGDSELFVLVCSAGTDFQRPARARVMIAEKDRHASPL
ncbi:hypothetical protein CYMTET_51665, partial [Cymbomonas tetramitiformis]